MINFAKAMQADLDTLSDGPRKLVPPGDYVTIIKGVEQKKFKKGSKGMVFTYLVTEGTEEGSEIKENIVMIKAPTVGKNEKDETVTIPGEEIDFNFARIKQRLLAGGFTAEYLLNGFKNPKGEKDLGDFVKLIGRAVRVTVDHQIGEVGTLKGKTMIQVKKVVPLTEPAE